MTDADVTAGQYLLWGIALALVTLAARLVWQWLMRQ